MFWHLGIIRILGSKNANKQTKKHTKKSQNTNKTATHKYHIIGVFFYSKNIRGQETESGKSNIL